MKEKKSRMSMSASMRRWMVGVAVLVLLGLGNALASMLEWHDYVAMLIFNCICVFALVAVVLEKISIMESRKKWRLLSFLFPICGVLAFVAARAVDGGEYDKFVPALVFVGVMLIVYGVVCIVRWRKQSLAHKDFLRKQRDK